MKKFIIQLFSNRFGIVLAAINLCYLASKAGNYRFRPLDPFFASANAPAFISSLFSLEIMKIFWQPMSSAVTTNFIGIFLVFFVTLQWLFIAWIAKTLAAKFRPKEL